MMRKLFVLVFAVVALLSIGVLFVAAQDDQPVAPQCGYGMMEGMTGMHGMGSMMGQGRGMMLGMDDMPGMTAVAEALGMEVYYYDVIKKLPLGNAKSLFDLDDVLEKADFVTVFIFVT